MGKLSGVLMIFGGCVGILRSWYLRQRKRQAVAAEFIRFLAHWEYSLECERVRLFEFLENYETSLLQMDVWRKELLLKLRAMDCPSGETAWRQVFGSQRENLDLDSKMQEALLDAAGAFFGNSSRESLRCAGASRRRLEQYLENARLEFARKQKVYMPVGMLMGTLLIIILI